MFVSAAKRLYAGLAIGLVAALTVAGVATAQGGAGSKGHPAGQPRRQGPPPIGLPVKGLSYAELHVTQNREEKTITVDQGKVLSVSESSITLSENNGSEVTIQTDDETQVKSGPGSEASLEDLQGKLVLVCAPSGGAAQTIIVEPKRGGPNGNAGNEGPGDGEGGEGGGEGPEGVPFGRDAAAAPPARSPSLRSRTSVPIIMLSARDEEIDRVAGLEAGADDYVSKPFSPRELVARVKAILRRTGTSGAALPAGERLALRGIALDGAARTVTVDGRPVELTAREFDLLAALLSHPGIVLSRDRLLEMVWDGEFPGGTRTVDVHVAQLRGKLGLDGFIETVRGSGYKVSP